MYRERLVATPTHSDSARRLQQLLLDYHDFRQYKATHSLLEHTFRIADWQAERLKAPTRTSTNTPATTPAWNSC